jgi:hypothetical protein
VAEPRTASPAALTPASPIARAAAAFGVFLPLAGVSAAITVLFLGMRAVIDIGGACAQGTSVVQAQPCPRRGVDGLIVGAICVGLVLVAVYVWQCARRRVPSVAAFAWPALFLSLGWNFFEYGLDPPGGGVAWGWLVWAVAFAAMGGIPLALLIGAVRDVWTSPRRPTRAAEADRPITGALAPRVTPAMPGTPASPGTPAVPATPATPATAGRGEVNPTKPSTAKARGTFDPDEFLSSFERLDALHRSGALDDAEYKAAKRRLLGTEGDA